MAPILFGWPFIILSILASAAGILTKRAAWLLLGAFLAVPFAFYIGGTPRFRIVGFFLPLLHLAAALAVQKGWRRLAWLFILPYVALAAWLAWTVLNQ
jgi:hypothetical protein